jgi:hypothetical protein
MGFQFAGKAVYSAVWVAAFSLFMELLGFSTQKWVTAGGFGTVLLTLAGREVCDLSLLITLPTLLCFTVLVVAMILWNLLTLNIICLDIHKLPFKRDDSCNSAFCGK